MTRDNVELSIFLESVSLRSPISFKVVVSKHIHDDLDHYTRNYAIMAMM